jgi:hypothetical protein
MTFTTLGAAPIVVTNPANPIGPTTGTLNGTVTAQNSSTTVTFEWGPTVALGNVIAGTPSPVTGNTATPVSANLTGLTTNQTYYFRCVGVNGFGTTNGTILNFIAGCPPIPQAGAITGPTSVCVNSTGKVYSIAAIPNATGYVWSVPAGATITAGAGTTSITVTFGTTSGNVSVYGTSICATGASNSLAVTVNPLPVPTITGPATACSNIPGIVYTTQTGMTNYLWTVSAGGTITAGGTTTSNTVTVTWITTGAQTVTVNYTNANGCTAVNPVSYPVTVNPSPSPTIMGNTTPCAGPQYVNYYTEGGMSNYVWTVSAGGTIYSGQGTANLQVIWNTAGPQTLGINYTNSFGCSLPSPAITNIFVNPYPSAAGSITGPATVCAGQNGVAYSTTTVLNATTYTWTVPPGATIATGAGTTSITVNYGPSATSGNVTVAGTNMCGNGTGSSLAVTVNPLPAAAGTITGPAVICAPANGISYTVPAIANATGYSWSVPSGANIVSGGNTNHITVNFTASATSGVITVLGTNACGNGQVSPDFNVTANPTPPTPVITESGLTLTSSAPTGNQWYFNGTAIPGATGQTYEATQSGDYYVIVTLNGCPSAQSNTITIVMPGIGQPEGSSLAIFPVPNDGRFTVTCTWTNDELLSLEVINSLGARIYQSDLQVSQGTAQQVVDLRPVPNGIYTVVLKIQDNRVIRRILVNK